MAADSADVKVTGSITPSACRVSLTGGGIIDYGNISPRDLATDYFTQLQGKSLELGIVCDAPAKVGITSIDAREGAAAVPPQLEEIRSKMRGLGQANGKNIGSYVMLLDTVSLDGGTKSIDYILSSDQGKSWHKSGTSSLGERGTYIYSWKFADDDLPPHQPSLP